MDTKSLTTVLLVFMFCFGTSHAIGSLLKAMMGMDDSDSTDDSSQNSPVNMIMMSPGGQMMPMTGMPGSVSVGNNYGGDSSSMDGMDMDPGAVNMGTGPDPLMMPNGMGGFNNMGMNSNSDFDANKVNMKFKFRTKFESLWRR